tara:strand:+ start:1101 stop:1268 length:168 start_codon:yes stop_codon:yes gene_type:complete
MSNEIKPVLIHLRDDVNEAIKDFAKANRLSKSKAIEDAIILHLQEHGERVDGQQS